MRIITATYPDFLQNIYVEATDDSVEYEDLILVATSRGNELLKVLKTPYNISEQDIVETEGKMIRFASAHDLSQYEANESKADKAFQYAKQAIKDTNLEMHLVNAKYTLDQKKLIFNFTASERIDFRDLVKVLANKYRTRIELRQISVRDEAKYLGGIGPCGRAHCCSTFLGDFVPVSIQMAKNQDLSLSPTKISGACGRLMCCLNFEDEYYEDTRRSMPDVGEIIETADGRGKVIGINILDLVVKVKYEDDYIREHHQDELQMAKEV